VNATPSPDKGVNFSVAKMATRNSRTQANYDEKESGLFAAGVNLTRNLLLKRKFTFEPRSGYGAYDADGYYGSGTIEDEEDGADA